MDEIVIPWEGWELAKEKEIGRGAFGNVYEIKRSTYGDVEHAAMKILRVPQNESDIDYLRLEGKDDESISQTYHGYVQDVIREYKLMRSLENNPNVVHVYDYKVREDNRSLVWTVYIRMELLTPIMKKRDSIQEERQILRLAKDICNALIACHKRNILHRDIKPENIFLDEEGNFKIGDFGISRVVEHTTHASVGVGTYDYMSPEVLLGQSYGTQADIYSLGMVLYWALNQNRHPFLPLPPVNITAEMKEEARRRKWRGEPVFPPANGCRDFQAVVMRACEFYPKNRYLTAESMLEALNKIVLPGPSVAETQTRSLPNEEILTWPGNRKPTGNQNADNPPNNGTPGQKPGGLTDIPLDDEPGSGTTIQDSPPPDSGPGKDRKGHWLDLRKIGYVLLMILFVMILLRLSFADKKEDRKLEAPTSPVAETVAETKAVPAAMPQPHETVTEPTKEETVTVESTEAEKVATEPTEEGYAPTATCMEEIGAQRVFVDAWRNGGIRVNVYDEKRISIDLTDEFFSKPESRDQDKSVLVRLYHSLARNNGYTISFRYENGALTGSAIYMEGGSTEYNYTPDSFTWDVDGDTAHMDLTATDGLPWDMFAVESIQVVYCMPDEAPKVETELTIQKTAAKVLFQHLEGPDEANGGEITEKAILVGLDAEGNPMWTHLSDVKFEIYQSARVESIGYINDRYYYTDDAALVILDAATGDVIKRVDDFGWSVTDGFVDYDGTVYFCCYNGPYFIEVDENGNIVHKIEDVGNLCDWACEIYRDGGSVFVVCELGPNPYRADDYIFEISLKDYTCTLTNPDEPIE